MLKPNYFVISLIGRLIRQCGNVKLKFLLYSLQMSKKFYVIIGYNFFELQNEKRWPGEFNFYLNCKFLPYQVFKSINTYIEC